MLDGRDGFSPLVWTPGVTGRRRAVAMSVVGVEVGAAEVMLARVAARLKRVQVENCMMNVGDLERRSWQIDCLEFLRNEGKCRRL